MVLRRGGQQYPSLLCNKLVAKIDGANFQLTDVFKIRGRPGGQREVP